MCPAAPRTTRRQSPEQTRAQILEAAQAFLAERSFRELNVDALMARTGHSRTVFYRHFEDIPSLVLTLIQEVGAELVLVAQEWAQVDRTGADVARARLSLFVGFYVRHGRLVHAITEAAHHDDSVEQAYRGMVDGFIALAEQAIAERVATGEVGALDVPEVARALVLMLNTYLEDALGRRDADPERVLETVATIWTRTVFPTG